MAHCVFDLFDLFAFFVDEDFDCFVPMVALWPAGFRRHTTIPRVHFVRVSEACSIRNGTLT